MESYFIPLTVNFHVDIKVVTSQIVNGHPITARQLEVLQAIRSEGSKNAAAKKLGISTPVVHNYISAVEKGTGIQLLMSTPNGTELTEDAYRILEVAEMTGMRCELGRKFTVACTPVTEELLLSLMSPTKIKGELIISDDHTNMRLLREGLVDVIILDDPVFLFDLEGYHWSEVGSMDMVHVDNGPSYVKYRYGAQRIAYSYLDAIGKDYTIDSEVSLVQDLLNSGKSFFIDEFLLLRRGIKVKSATDKGTLKHSINAVYRKDTRCVQRLLRAIKQKRVV